ncbi:BnaC02g46430D [Brassica napus]|uniref:BnaC02g46430D protein n=1 Tax=Brassica napus TaxID=3708 RepID=A0A078JPM5_BRANA|nr:BnaC02g46430D [Brassica napus]
MKSGEAAPAVVLKATKPLKKVKREPEDDDLETKTNLKKQKKDVVDTTERLFDHLKRMESKFDLLVTKLDLLISVEGKGLLVNKFLKAKAEISSSEDESSSSDEDSVEKPPVAKVSSSSESENASEDEKETLATSSDSSDDEESDQGEKPEQKMEGTSDSMVAVEVVGLLEVLLGGRCGGLGHSAGC